MNWKKELISYYDMGGETAEKYGIVDDFLKLTERFSHDSIRKAKISTTAVCLAVGAALAGLGILVNNLLVCLASVLLLMPVYAVWSSAAKGLFPDEVRSKGIMEADGLDAVYDDLLEAGPFKDSDIYVGRKYVFLKGRCVIRLADIESLVIYKDSGEDIDRYYAEAKVTDGFSDDRVKLTDLPGNEIKRAEVFGGIKQYIGTAGGKLTDMELKTLALSSDNSSSLSIST